MFREFQRIISPLGPFFGGGDLGLPNPIRHLPMTATVHFIAKAAEGPIRILEVGSWVGASALAWSEALDKFGGAEKSLLCVDPWAPYFPDFERENTKIYDHFEFMLENGLAYDLFRHNTTFAPDDVQIDHFRGTLGELAKYLPEESFDLIYLDGSHYYEDVVKDLKTAVPLLKPDGVLCGDDLELQFEEVDHGVMDANLNVDFVLDPKSNQKYHPGVTKAVHEVVGPASAFLGYWVMQKTVSGFAPVSLNGCQAFIPKYHPKELKNQFVEMFPNLKT